jgi:hypothetical protein
MRRRVDAAMDHMADAIKDALIDGFDLGDDSDEEPAAESLPPVLPEEFVEAMRGRVEQTLRKVAAAINVAPGEAVPAAGVEETCDLFTELWLEALRVGVRLRLEAADRLQDAYAAEEPPSEWARRYRRMHAVDPSDDSR